MSGNRTLFPRTLKYRSIGSTAVATEAKPPKLDRSVGCNQFADVVRTAVTRAPCTGQITPRCGRYDVDGIHWMDLHVQARGKQVPTLPPTMAIGNQCSCEAKYFRGIREFLRGTADSGLGTCVYAIAKSA